MIRRWKFGALVIAIFTALVAVPAIAVADDDDDDDRSTRTYEVTIENLTGAQILTPPVFAGHNRGFDLFSAGQPASVWLKEVSENGNVGPLATSLGQTRGVKVAGVASSDAGTVADGAGPIFAGETRTWTFELDKKAKYLSTASMVVCTNDGFAGLDRQKLPSSLDKTVMVYADALDAGTEINTESFADLVPPCSGNVTGSGVSNPDLFESGVIHPHAGIAGTGDLAAAMWGWDGAVAKFTITRTS
jgi:hypothetical protein